MCVCVCVRARACVCLFACVRVGGYSSRGGGAAARSALNFSLSMHLQPYPSVVLHQLCDEQRLRRVRDEIVNNIDATFKETDLFKVCSIHVFCSLKLCARGA